MKEKVAKIINKYDNLFVIIVIILSITGIVLDIKLANSDEIWNFQNVYKMYNGFVIYKESNVIVTPLFFYIGEILFKLLGANFLIFRIYNIIIVTGIYFLEYKILKELKIRKKISLILVLFLILFKWYGLPSIQANYNSLAFLFYLLGVFCYIKKYKYNNIIQGIILFLIFMSKQNIGAFYAISLFIIEIFSEKNNKNKIIDILKTYLIFIFLLLIFIAIYYQKNILNDFMNFAVQGIAEFSNRNKGIEIQSAILLVFFNIINLYLTWFYIKHKIIDKNEKEKIIILNIFALCSNLIVYPIFNTAHFMYAINMVLILFIGLIKILIDKNKFTLNKKVINIIFYILIIACMVISSVYYIDSYIKIHNENYYFSKKDPFYGVDMKENLYKNIENVTNYIKNNDKHVIVLSSKAAFYMIPLKSSNVEFDLPFKGNLGKNGEEGLLQKIINLKDTYILLDRNEKDVIYQESERVREYIKNNFEKDGEIEEFDIYINIDKTLQKIQK